MSQEARAENLEFTKNSGAFWKEAGRSFCLTPWCYKCANLDRENRWVKCKSTIRYLATKRNPLPTITHSFHRPSDSTLVSSYWTTGFTQGDVSLYTDLASGSCTVPVQAEGYRSWCHSWESLSGQVTATVTIHLQSWCLPTMHLNQLVIAYLSVHFQKLVNMQKHSHNGLSQMFPNILLIIKGIYA